MLFRHDFKDVLKITQHRLFSIMKAVYPNPFSDRYTLLYRASRHFMSLIRTSVPDKFSTSFNKTPVSVEPK